MAALVCQSVLQYHEPVGLVDAIYREAREERDAGTLHHHGNSDDGLREQRLLWHIIAVHPIRRCDHFFDSKLQNTLPHDYHQELASNGSRTITWESKDESGVYMNQVMSPHPEHEGKSLTTKQIRRLIAVYRAYMDKKPTAVAMNNAIDDKFGDDRERRCYVKDEAQRQKGRHFCRILEAQYCRVHPDTLDEMHSSSPAEVGCFQNVARRVLQHARNGSSTYVFAFVNALAQLPVSLGGFRYGLPKAWYVFAAWKGCQRLARVAEITASVLTGNYIRYGGYNPVHAGKFKLELHANDASWDTAKLTVQTGFHPELQPRMAEELETVKGRVRRTLGDADDAETSGDTGGAPRRTLLKANAKLEAVCERLRAKEQPYQVSFERFCLRLNQATPPGEARPWVMQPGVDTACRKGISASKRSLNERLFCRFKMRLDRGLIIDQGLLLYLNRRTKPKKAEVSRRSAHLAASVDGVWEEFPR
ncbi:MAG: hypothetical protein Q9173_004471 [Seirophora scorigena]